MNYMLFGRIDKKKECVDGGVSEEVKRMMSTVAVSSRVTSKNSVPLRVLMLIFMVDVERERVS